MLCARLLFALLPGMIFAASPARAQAPAESLVGEPFAATGAPAAATDMPWIVRHRPARHTFELGLAFGALFPSPRHGLVEDAIQRESAGMFYQRFRPFAPDYALRAAYFPLTFLGVEVEGSIAPAYTREFTERANIYGFGGHLIAQLSHWSATPYLLAGGGLLATSGALGIDRDPAIRVGIGAKVFVNERLIVRCELRDTLARGVAGATAHSLQFSIGLSLRLGVRADRRAPAITAR